MGHSRDLDGLQESIPFCTSLVDAGVKFRIFFRAVANLSFLVSPILCYVPVRNTKSEYELQNYQLEVHTRTTQH
ncbi:Hypothetical predicted protein [Octopus vulgaris]|uniref:Uncharacterized protein n=1 Tax=Octopus vulgaris TaxID=6645 RepID=A0AA36FBU3_OCTVU|nr:Hypothetical predicted protein [Octopus vulgaris]